MSKPRVGTDDNISPAHRFFGILGVGADDEQNPVGRDDVKGRNDESQFAGRIT